MRVALLCDQWPELSETFVLAEARALRELGVELGIEAAGPAETPNPEADLGAALASDDTTRTRLAALLRLVAAHPLRCTRDLLPRRRWRGEERVPPLRALAPVAMRVRRADHLHAHFAAGAALTAMRLSRILGVPYSVTAHGYDIFQRPANLREKLEGAAFATSGSDYTVAHLRALAPRARVEKIVMGVDTERFRRRTPYPGGRRVVAIARLVEKKGFEYLVSAEGDLEIVIVGDGPLAASLRERARDGVRFTGALPPEQVREQLESADVLAAPCVVASDGDRDSMPVVVKEALAMEIPVVGTDEVGLPELIHPEWGALVPPRDAEALARAISAVLDRPPEERAAMGRAGRAFVEQHCNVVAETRRLLALIEGSAAAA